MGFVPRGNKIKSSKHRLIRGSGEGNDYTVVQRGFVKEFGTRLIKLVADVYRINSTEFTQENTGLIHDWVSGELGEYYSVIFA